MDLQPGDNQRYVISRKQEENWAADHSRITKILGYCMLGGFVFQIISAAFTDHLQLDILLLFGGCAVLRGSQAWVRFYAFIATCAAVTGLLHVAIAYLKHEPLEHANRWIDHRDTVFWQEYIASIGIYLGLAVLCVVVLRSRRLVFWTGAAKKWVIFAAAVVACVSGLVAVLKPGQYTPSEEDLLASQNDIRAIRSFVTSSGLSSTQEKLREKLAANPSIDRVSLRRELNVSRTIYSKRQDTFADGYNYVEFVKNASGEWVKIEIEFLRP